MGKRKGGESPKLEARKQELWLALPQTSCAASRKSRVPFARWSPGCKALMPLPSFHALCFVSYFWTKATLRTTAHSCTTVQLRVGKGCRSAPCAAVCALERVSALTTLPLLPFCGWQRRPAGRWLLLGRLWGGSGCNRCRWSPPPLLLSPWQASPPHRPLLSCCSPLLMGFGPDRTCQKKEK